MALAFDVHHANAHISATFSPNLMKQDKVLIIKYLTFCFGSKSSFLMLRNSYKVGRCCYHKCKYNLGASNQQHTWNKF